MANDVKIACGFIQAKTSDGLQEHTLAGVTWTPKAAIICGARNTSLATNQTDLDGWMSVMAQGRARCMAITDDNGVGTSEAYRWNYRAAAVMMDDTSGLEDKWALFEGFVAGGVELDWGHKPLTVFPSGEQYMFIMLFGGADLDANVREFTVLDSSGSLDITNIGFEADQVVLLSAGDTGFRTPGAGGVSPNPDAFANLGFASNGGNQVCKGWFIQDGAATGAHGGQVRDNRIFQRGDQTSAGSDLTIGSFDGSGFTLTIGNSDGADIDGAVLALKYNGSLTGHSVHLHQPPTTAQVENDTAPGFKPQAALLSPTQHNSLGYTVNHLASVLGLGGMCGLTGQNDDGCVQWMSRENNTTMNSRQRTVGIPVFSRNHVGNAVYSADPEDWLDDGFALDYGDPAPNTRYVLAMTIGTLLHSASGSGGLAAMTAAGVAELRFEASGSGGLAALSAAAVAELRFEATGSGGLAALTAAAVAVQQFEASGTGGLAAMSATGVAVQQFEAAGQGQLAALQAAAVAELEFQAAGTGQLAALGATAVAEAVHEASGSGALPALEAAAVAEVVNEASGQGDLAALTAAGTAELEFIASGAGVLPALVGAGAAQIVVDDIDCPTELAGSYDVRTDLAGSHDERTDLAASHDLRTDLEGSYDVVTELRGSYDVRTDLKGEC